MSPREIARGPIIRQIGKSMAEAVLESHRTPLGSTEVRKDGNGQLTFPKRLSSGKSLSTLSFQSDNQASDNFIPECSSPKIPQWSYLTYYLTVPATNSPTNTAVCLRVCPTPRCVRRTWRVCPYCFPHYRFEYAKGPNVGSALKAKNNPFHGAT